MKCPYCAEDIKDEALACRYCGRDLACLMIKPMLERISSLEDQVLDIAASLNSLQKSERTLTDKPDFTKATYSRVSRPNPDWKRTVLATLFAALLPIILFFVVSAAGEARYLPLPSAQTPGVLEVIFLLAIVVVVLVPLPLGGFWVGLAWPSRPLHVYTLLGLVLGLVSAEIGTAVHTLLAPFVLPFGEEENPFGLLFGLVRGLLFDTPETEASLLLSLLGPSLIFVSGVVFADVWQKWKTPNREEEPHLEVARAIADKIAGRGKGPSERSVQFIQILGPSLLGLVGTVFTVLYK